MSMELRTLTCAECGKTFWYTTGGIIANPMNLAILARPVCSKCKMKKIKDLIKGKR